MKPTTFFTAILFLILAFAPAAQAQQGKARINWTAVTGAQRT